MIRCNMIVLCFVVVGVLEFVISRDIPDYIHICHRSDPKVTACIKNAIEALRPILINGIPELNIQGIDPFHIDSLTKSNPGLISHLENIDVKGAGNFEITKLKLDIDNMTYRVGIKIPYLILDGHYKIDARILATQIVGTGKYHANTTKIEGHAIIQGYVYKLQRNLMKFNSIDFKIHLGNFNVRLEPLTGGSNDVLSQAANLILSSNKADLIQLATPAIERKCSEIFLRLANQITDNLDYDEVFPL